MLHGSGSVSRQAARRRASKEASQVSLPAACQKEISFQLRTAEQVGGWIDRKLERLLGFQDDVVSSMILNELTEPKSPTGSASSPSLSPPLVVLTPSFAKQLRVTITPFIGEHTESFMNDLWQFIERLGETRKHLARRHSSTRTWRDCRSEKHSNRQDSRHRNHRKERFERDEVKRRRHRERSPCRRRETRSTSPSEESPSYGDEEDSTDSGRQRNRLERRGARRRARR